MRDVFASVRMTEGTITTADVFLIGDTAYETGFWNFTIGPSGPRRRSRTPATTSRSGSATARASGRCGVISGSRACLRPSCPSRTWARPPARSILTARGRSVAWRRARPAARGGIPRARLKAIRFGRLIDGKGHTIQDALVLVDGERIRSVAAYSKAAVPAGAEQFDFTRLTGIPGLIDVHTHMTYWWDRAPGSRPWQQLEARPAMQTLYMAEENARRTLETGVTTVRDLGSFQYMDISMRDLINRGAMVGPRMFVAGYGLYPTMSPSRTRRRRRPEGTRTAWRAS